MVIFPDTNVLAHFAPLEDWEVKYLSSDPTIIALAPSIISELDKVKYSAASTETKRRVQRLVKKLGDNPQLVFKDLKFIFADGPTPLAEYMANHHLDTEDKDDHFFASLLYFREQNPQENVAALTNDLGVKLKCKRHQIAFIPAPEEYLIQESDEATRELKRLTAEVNRLKNLQPVLSMLFDNDKQHKTFKVSEPWRDYEYAVVEGIAEIKTKHPYLKPEQQQQNSLGLMLLDLYQKTPEKVEKYNAALGDYFKQYESYLRRKFGGNYKRSLTLQIELSVSNTGTTPADNVDIYLHFPDGFVLREQDEYYKVEPEPDPPELSHYQLAPLDLTKYLYPSPNFALPSIGNFSIKKTNSYEVTDARPTVKHHYSYLLKKLFVTFDSYEEVKGFAIEYSITASNLVDKAEGTLHVAIEKENLDEISEDSD